MRMGVRNKNDMEAEVRVMPGGVHELVGGLENLGKTRKWINP